MYQMYWTHLVQYSIIKVIQSRTPMNTIQVTDEQLEYLQDLVLEAYSLDVDEMKDWDKDTFEGLVDAVCGARADYL